MGAFSFFRRKIRVKAKQLIELRTLVEATLDFPEEEIDPVDRKDAQKRLNAARDLAKKVGVEIKQVWLTNGESDLVSFVYTRSSPVR